ncbi:sensor histidine kinase [Methylorubrum salsuginis]|uniref:Signal transduction histidine kinase n=1 Tax=Methylorubrum salsuginis TaxID=414703 RepID=A0A1I4I7B7_9HYPH|nr:histidine kinase [Methylorubrum salsuginis]SFL50170.1 Signal transduction histidine kinase [Methylorubrum salsuginis]
MTLAAHLGLRLVLVAVLCLAGAVAWTVREAQGGLRSEAAISAERIAAQFGRQPGLGSAGPPQRLAGEPASAAPAILTLLPGICAEIRLGAETPRRFCGDWDGLGAAPGWLRVLVAPGAESAMERTILYRGRTIGQVAAWPDREAAAARLWREVRLSGCVALVLTAAAAGLGWIATLRLVAPAARIVRGLERLDAGAPTSLPRFAVAEFDRIAQACNRLADRLGAAEAERGDLLRRLVAVQEEERQGLARDLHDAFGQCLAAAGARAAAIEAAAPADRDDLREDARGIEAVVATMRESLRGALARLELPDLAETGLFAALHDLVAQWQDHVRGGPVLHLDAPDGRFEGSPEASASLYRIAQELLTNALRHGRPSRVFVRLETATGATVLTVDDDGGGDAARALTAPGRGLTGIRARLAALGGSLSLTGTGNGLRARATVPMPA